MTWAILGPYLIAMVLLLGIGNFIVVITVLPINKREQAIANRWHARVSLAAIAWPLVIPVALLYALFRIPGWMVKLVKTADLPPLRTKEKK